MTEKVDKSQIENESNNVLIYVKSRSFPKKESESISKNLDIIKTFNILPFGHTKRTITSMKKTHRTVDSSGNISVSNKSSKLCLLDNGSSSFGMSSLNTRNVRSFTSDSSKEKATTTSPNIVFPLKFLSVEPKKSDIYTEMVNPLRYEIPDVDMNKFLMTPLIKNKMLVCNLIVKNSNPIAHEMELKINCNDRIILKARRECGVFSTKYTIFLASRLKDIPLGKISSNSLKVEYKIFEYKNGLAHMLDNSCIGKIRFDNKLRHLISSRNKLTRIQTSFPIIKQKGKFSYIIDKASLNKDVFNIREDGEPTKRNLTEDKNWYVLNSVLPHFNLINEAYYMNMAQRVRLPSKNNFILCYNDKNVLRFGKTDKNKFSLDFSYPLTPFQAFCICICAISHNMIL